MREREIEGGRERVKREREGRGMEGGEKKDGGERWRRRKSV